MKKLLFLSLSMAIILISCQNTKQESNDETNIDSVKTEKLVENYSVVDINKFDSLIDDYIDQIIIIEGTCVHTCKHGGGKMHIVGDNPDNKIIVMATDESGKFNVEMEGLKYRITGKVIENSIDSAYLEQWEQRILKDEHEGGKAIEHKHGDKSDNLDADEAIEKEMKLAKIDALRKEIAESPKGYLSDISIDCISYEEIK